MVPITKNIIVVDEQGKEYEATYAKRAKGLVKKGRARFVDENKICLACPPINILEDNNMTENINKPLELTMDYVLSRIDEIMKDNSHIREAIEAIRYMSVNEGPSGDGSESSRSEAITNTVQSREATNQQLIRLLEKMYDDLKPKQPKTDAEIEIANKLIESISELTPYEAKEVLSEQLKRII